MSHRYAARRLLIPFPEEYENYERQHLHNIIIVYYKLSLKILFSLIEPLSISLKSNKMKDTSIDFLLNWPLLDSDSTTEYYRKGNVWMRWASDVEVAAMCFTYRNNVQLLKLGSCKIISYLFNKDDFICFYIKLSGRVPTLICSYRNVYEGIRSYRLMIAVI